jgi:cytoskeletal protein CcmA (bactofilin family)
MNRLDDHFDEVTGLLYLEHQLDPEHTRAVSEHLASCAACSGLLRALESESLWLRESLTAEEESIPARLIAAPERGTIQWGWVAAFGLAVGGAYTLWSGIVEPWVARAQQAGFTQGYLLTMLFFSGASWKGWDAMRSLTEFLALATLGTVAIWFLRKHWQRFTTIAFVMGALVLSALAFAPSAAAADIEHGNPSYTLPAGHEVKTDLIVAADRARIDGEVDGDLISFSSSLTVNGHVKGDILAFGAEIRVNGPVDGNVRVWGQSLTLGSAVAKNVMAWIGAAEFDEKSTVGGTLTMLSGAAELNGKIAGDVLAYVGDLSIGGSLGHDVIVRGGRLTVGPNAEIVGQTKYTGDREPEVSPGAKLGSAIQYTVPKRGPDYTRANYYLHRVFFWGASFVFGLVLLLVAPGFFADTEQASKKIGPAMGFGVLFLFATPIAALIACITIVGLGIGISALFLYLIAIYSAQVFVGSWLGEQLLGSGVGIGAAVGRLALGLAIVRLLTMVPFAGPWIHFVVIIWGLGALVLALHKRMGPQVAAAA